MSCTTILGQPPTGDELRNALPLPAPDANKYSRGRLTIVAGSPRYPGAAVLAASAGVRMGAGYTEVVSCETAARLVLTARPSIVVHDACTWLDAGLSSQKPDAKRAICIGPGFDSNDPLCGKLVIYVLREAACPVLVDGGGLAFLCSKKGRKALAARRKEGRTTVITPHGGEAARLQEAYGIRMEELYGETNSQASWQVGGLASDRDCPTPPEAALIAAALANATGAVVALKGPDTFIASPEATPVRPLYEGTSALAKAGTGDVLAGMIAALLAQGVEPAQAALVGAALHARAGIAAAHTFTDVGVGAEDVVEAIPDAIRTVISE